MMCLTTYCDFVSSSRWWTLLSVTTVVQLHHHVVHCRGRQDAASLLQVLQFDA